MLLEVEEEMELLGFNMYYMQIYTPGQNQAVLQSDQWFLCQEGTHTLDTLIQTPFPCGEVFYCETTTAAMVI